MSIGSMPRTGGGNYLSGRFRDRFKEVWLFLPSSYWVPEDWVTEPKLAVGERRMMDQNRASPCVAAFRNFRGAKAGAERAELAERNAHVANVLFVSHASRDFGVHTVVWFV